VARLLNSQVLKSTTLPRSKTYTCFTVYERHYRGLEFVIALEQQLVYIHEHPKLMMPHMEEEVPTEWMRDEISAHPPMMDNRSSWDSSSVVSWHWSEDDVESYLSYELDMNKASSMAITTPTSMLPQSIGPLTCAAEGGDLSHPHSWSDTAQDASCQIQMRQSDALGNISRVLRNCSEKLKALWADKVIRSRLQYLRVNFEETSRM
jgi:hypothetical protein